MSEERIPCKCRAGDGSTICPMEYECYAQWMLTRVASYPAPSPLSTEGEGNGGGTQ